jgi:GNAT superfamily N-acetyltransferase
MTLRLVLVFVRDRAQYNFKFIKYTKMAHVIGTSLPSGYIVRLARNYSDRWNLYKQLVLLREPEPQGIYFSLWLLSLLLFLLLFGVTIFSYVTYLAVMREEPSVLNLSIIAISYSILISVSIIIGIYLGLTLVFLIDTLWIRDSRRIAIATHRGRIVGGVQLNLHQKQITLAGLYVSPRHRNRGLGSYLVNYILSQASLPIHPIYVIAIPSLEKFYTRLGFVKDQKKRGYNMIYDPKTIR